MLSSLLTATILSVPFLLANGLVFHFLNPKNRVKSIGVVWLIFAVFTAVLAAPVTSLSVWSVIDIKTQSVIITCALFTFAAYAYLQIYFVVTCSITLEFMVQIDRAPRRALTLAELERVFPMAELLQERVDAMVQKNLLMAVKRNEQTFYVPTRRCLLIGAVFSHLKNFLKMGRGG